MKRHYVRAAILMSIGFSIPLFVFADTWKGAPALPPPQGNTAGVIWNSINVGQQTGAEINIDGKANVGSALNVGGTATVGSNLDVAGPATVGSNLDVTGVATIAKDTRPQQDILLTSERAFRVDQDASSTFFMGNWGGTNPPGSAKPLTMNLNGDLMVGGAFNPLVGQGNEGRVQARKFCLYPGTDADCITSWPTGQSGLYVQKIGDAMTGPLSIVTPSFGVDVSGGNFGGNFSGKNWGVEAVSDNLGLYAHMNVAGVGTAVWGTGGKVGGLFEGSTTGLQARTSAAGSGKAVIGSNGAYGGDFSGTQYGVFGQGGLTGGYFVNAGTGLYAQLGTANYGLYSNGKIFTTGTMHATGDLDTSGNLTVTGNIVAPANQLSNCQLVPPANNANPGFADGVLGTCPAGIPIMNGIKRLANMTALYCCAL